MAKFFKASSWDPLLQIITVGVYLFALAFMYYNPKSITILIFGSLVLIPPFFMVKGYSIDDHKLIIHRLGWTTEFDIQDLVDVEFNAQALSESSRLLGNGGLFGWLGTFNHKKLGSFKAYATNRYKCVILELKEQRLLITPDSPNDFVKNIQSFTHT